MNTRKIGTWLMAGLVLVALAAPAARADSGPWMRWKQGYRDPRGYQREHFERGGYGYRSYGHSGAGPALVGFLGGLVIGSQLNHHVVYEHEYCPPPTRVIYTAPPQVSCDRYEYYDPYSDRSFRSLDDCYQAMRDDDDDAPMVVEQIDVRSGQCVETWCWSDGGWRRGHDGNWSH